MLFQRIIQERERRTQTEAKAYLEAEVGAGRRKETGLGHHHLHLLTRAKERRMAMLLKQRRTERRTIVVIQGQGADHPVRKLTQNKRTAQVEVRAYPVVEVGAGRRAVTGPGPYHLHLPARAKERRMMMLLIQRRTERRKIVVIQGQGADQQADQQGRMLTQNKRTAQVEAKAYPEAEAGRREVMGLDPYHHHLPARTRERRVAMLQRQRTKERKKIAIIPGQDRGQMKVAARLLVPLPQVQTLTDHTNCILLVCLKLNVEFITKVNYDLAELFLFVNTQTLLYLLIYDEKDYYRRCNVCDPRYQSFAKPLNAFFIQYFCKT